MKAPELRMAWSKKERDWMIHYPRRADGHLLWGAFKHDRLLGGKTLLEELAARGYDTRTLRISCRLLLPPESSKPETEGE